MRLPGKRRKTDRGPSPEDTQEMFTTGLPLAETSEETREYEAVANDEAGRPEPAATEPFEELEAEDELIEGEDDEASEDETAGPEDFEGEDVEEDADPGFSGEPEQIDGPEDDELGEAWKEDEFAEWEGEDGVDEDDPTEPARPAGVAAAAAATAAARAWFVELAARSRAVGSSSLERIGSIRLPRHEIDGQKVLAAAGILAIVLMVGAAGFLLGKGSGEDVDTARLSGEFAGKRDGAVAGAAEGYAAGFKKGRDEAFRESYSASYRRNYIRAYKRAGMDPPDPKRIEVPQP